MHTIATWANGQTSASYDSGTDLGWKDPGFALQGLKWFLKMEDQDIQGELTPWNCNVNGKDIWKNNDKVRNHLVICYIAMENHHAINR